MRFDGLRTPSTSMLPPPKHAASNVRRHRGHSVLPPALTIPVSHSMACNTVPAASPNVSRTKVHAESSLPSVDKLFPRPDLASRMKKHLVRVANETSNALIRDTLVQGASSTKQWRPAPRRRGASGNVNVLRGASRGTNDTKDTTCVRAVSDDVHASIEEFALLFKLDSSREAADHLLLFNADLVQHATLYTLVAPSGTQPRRYVGVKWALVASPSRFFRNRDFCYLECQKEFTDAKGRRGWVRSLHSLNLPCCPSLEREHGIVRASIYRSGLTAIETDEPGVLSVTYTVELDLKGHTALEWFQPGFVAQRVAALATVDKLLQQQRLSSSPLLGDLDIPANKRTRGSCNLCFRDFVTPNGLRDTLATMTNMSTKSKRYVCRKCGDGVCRRCSDDWWLDVPVVGRTKVRICTVCSAAAKQSHSAAHAIRAGTSCPVQRHQQDLTMEVEGVTHPNLLDVSLRARGRSLSSLDRPSAAVAAYFAQQEQINRDLAIRATELSQRVQLWQQMQLYDRPTSSPLPAEASTDCGVAPQECQVQEAVGQKLSWLVGEQDEEKNEPETELRPQRSRVHSAAASSESNIAIGAAERHPSFLSVERSRTSASDQDGDEVDTLTAETGLRLSSYLCDTDLSDYEEHTIDGLGEIRTTTDVTRWWQDQQGTSKGREERARQQHEPSSIVTALNAGSAGKPEVFIQKQPQLQTVATLSEKEQELAGLYQWNQELAMEKPQRLSVNPRQRGQERTESAPYHYEPVHCRQQLELNELAQYQEEQLRRRTDVLELPQCRPDASPHWLVHPPLQQRPQELNRLPSGDDQRPRSSHAATDMTSVDEAKERYLQHQRQQQFEIAAERNKEARLRSSERKAGALMETF